MKVVCAWCQRQGTGTVLHEKEPHDNPAISHGICDAHIILLLDEARRTTLSESWVGLRAS